MRLWALAGPLATQHAKPISIEILITTPGMLIGGALHMCGLGIGFIL